MTERERNELADDLEHVVALFQRQIRCLRGEEVDLTGLGIEQIAIQALERVLKVKVLTDFHYEHLIGAEKELEALKKVMGKL